MAEGENRACYVVMSLLRRVKLMTVGYEDRLLGASLHKGSRLVRATSSQAVPVMRRSNQDGYPPPPTSSHQPRLAHKSKLDRDKFHFGAEIFSASLL